MEPFLDFLARIDQLERKVIEDIIRQFDDARQKVLNLKDQLRSANKARQVAIALAERANVPGPSSTNR